MADILEIDEVIRARDGALRADAIVARIMATIRTLSRTPGIGSARPYLAVDARAFSIRPWIVIYSALPDQEGIRVRRVLDGRRDIGAILRADRGQRIAVLFGPSRVRDAAAWPNISADSAAALATALAFSMSTVARSL
jgi:toxin ParE1/3/4